MKFINYVIQCTTLGIVFCAPPVFAEPTTNSRLSILGGITLGGDEIAGLSFLDGSTDSVYAGDFAYFGAGLEYSINEDFTLQLNAQYHWDVVTAVNGEVRFSRYEFEVIPYYQLSERYRIGLGLGMHTNIKVSADLNSKSSSSGFDNANAVIASIGRKMKYSDHWLEFRVVNVEYLRTIDNNSFNQAIFPIDGNHVGLSYHMLF